jgi:endonuclease/exonuclease/phosphatase family metal-dependent hydrolase
LPAGDGIGSAGCDSARSEAGRPTEGVIRVATYNIHAAVGADRRRDLGRIAAVIEEIGADVIGLQEVESRASRGSSDQAMRLAAMLEMACVEGPMLLEGAGWYGNAILSRLPILGEQRWRFADHSGEPRGAVGVVVDDPQRGRWRLITTHLDLWSRSRLRQVQSIVRLFESDRDDPWILMGDLNEWRPWAPALVQLRRLGYVPPAPASYPSLRPLFALDRMVLHDCSLAGPLRRHVTKLSRRASDHLPIVAEVGAPVLRSNAQDAASRSGGTKPLAATFHGCCALDRQAD